METLMHGPGLQNLFDATVDRLDIPTEDRQLLGDMLPRMKKHHEITYDHLLRVGIRSAAIGELFHLNLGKLLVGGALHDIGKEAVGTRILNEPSSLSVADRVVVQSHAQAGYDLLAQRNLLFARIAGGHHIYQPEGYGAEQVVQAEPDGEWDLYCRVVFVADQWDAQSVKRGYELDSGFYVPNARRALEGTPQRNDEAFLEMLAQRMDLPFSQN